MMKKICNAMLVGGALVALSAHADGDAARGKKVFAECAACHSLDKGVNGVGPSLNGVFDRKAGELADFRFSPAMKRSGLTWSARALDLFIADPQAEDHRHAHLAGGAERALSPDSLRARRVIQALLRPQSLATKDAKDAKKRQRHRELPFRGFRCPA